MAFQYDMADLKGAPWGKRLAKITNENGDFQPLGANYGAAHIDEGRTLLVSFESLEGINRLHEENAPIGWEFVKSHGWSSLSILSIGEEDWFRDRRVFGYVDRLIDDGFFDDFDKILFYGAGPAGYAAAAFSVAAPGARVLAIQPQATLERPLTNWDRRFPKARRLDFSGRFADATRMVETASDVYILHDPEVLEDAVHAAQFSGSNITHLSCPLLGPDARRGLLQMNILHDLIEMAMENELDAYNYSLLWRDRRSHGAYLRGLYLKLEAQGGHEALRIRLCEHVLKTERRPFFAEKLAELTGET